MIRLEFELDGKSIKEPLNYPETEIEISRDFDSPDFGGQISTNRWIFGLGANENEDAVKIINDYKNGKYGVFSGLSFKIYFNNDKDNPLFDGYLDLSRASYLCDTIEVEAIEKYGIDWFNKVVDTVSFQYLWRVNIITERDLVLIPYQVYSPGDRTQTIIILVSFSLLIFIYWNFIRTILALIKTASTGWGWETIFAIIDLLVAFFNFILQVTLFQNQLFTYLFVERKYKTGMYLKTLCDAGAKFLGYTFESSILDGSKYRVPTSNGSIGWDNVALIAKSYEQEIDRETGKQGLLREAIRLDLLQNVGYYKESYGDLLRELKKMFNAKIIIDRENKIIKLERRDEPESSGEYQVPPIDRTDTPYELNADELYGKYNVTFTPDEQDKVSLQYYKGTEYEVLTNLKAINSNGINIIQGEQIVNIGFGLTQMKTELFPQERFVRNRIKNASKFLNVPIKILNLGIKTINRVIRGLNYLLDIMNTLELYTKSVSINYLKEIKTKNLLGQWLTLYDDQRLNILMFESDYLTTHKLVALKQNYKTYEQVIQQSNNFITTTIEVNKPSKYQRDLLDSEYLWKNFHYINSFVEDTDAISSKHNQNLIYNLDNVPFCVEDYYKIKNNPVIKDYNGKQGEMISVKWNIYKQVASLLFKVNEIYTTNLQIFKNKSDGR